MEKTEKKENTVFEKLFNLNVNNHTEQKNTGTKDKPIYLTYLSWAWAWGEFKKVYPEATYQIKMWKQADGTEVPYFADNTGIMVMTSVQAGGLNYEMWLPVMDGANRSLKLTPYKTTKKQYDPQTRKSFVVDIEIAPATMFDINKTIMRCLTKNLAMFGLGLYIYAGEDLPETLQDEVDEKAIKQAEETIKQVEESQRKQLEPKKSESSIVQKSRDFWSLLNIQQNGGLSATSQMVADIKAHLEKLKELKEEKIYNDLNNLLQLKLEKTE